MCRDYPVCGAYLTKFALTADKMNDAEVLTQPLGQNDSSFDASERYAQIILEFFHG